MIRWFRQSFQRQLFLSLFAVMLTLVIAGGIFTIQGFQARIRSDYMTGDLRQQTLIMEKVGNMLSTAEDAVAGISENRDFIEAVKKRSKTGDIEIYNELYKETEAVREFGTVDIYIGNRRYYTTSSEEVIHEFPLLFGA